MESLLTPVNITFTWHLAHRQPYQPPACTISILSKFLENGSAVDCETRTKNRTEIHRI